MKRFIPVFLSSVFWLCTTQRSEAQLNSFHHLNTVTGLSDNNVRCMVVDKTGFLWIGTFDGLNSYDGYRISNYFREQEHDLASNNVEQLLCDRNNNIWIATAEGVTRVNGQRKFQRIALQDTVIRFNCINIIETGMLGIILYTDRGQFYLDSTTKKWEKLDGVPDKLAFVKLREVSPFSENQVIFSLDSLVAIFDYSSRKMVYEHAFFPVLSSCRVNDNQIAIGFQNGQIKVINIPDRQIIREYWPRAELDGKPINTVLNNIQSAVNGDLLVATKAAGLVRIDPTGHISNYTHNPLDQGSISANNTWKILAEQNGNVFIATGTSGINIFNIYNKQAGYKALFSDKEGRLFDNYLNDMVEDRDGSIWVAAYDRLINWDKNKNQSAYYYFYQQTGAQGQSPLTIRALCVDRNDRLWVSGLNRGLAYFDKRLKKLVPVDFDTAKGRALNSQYIRNLIAASDGKVWVCTNTGLYNFDPVTLGITTFDEHPLLKLTSGKIVVALYEDSRRNIWIDVAADGVYRYNPQANTIKKFGTGEGLLSTVCFGFQEDQHGNLYLGTQSGFNIITTDDKVRSYTKKNGLHYDRCEGFLAGDDGAMWIANNKCLIRFDPAKDKMQYFEGNSGISPYGFRVNSRLKTRSGELFFGGPRGVNYFYPHELVNNPESIKVAIYQAVLKDAVLRFDDNRTIRINYKNNEIQLFFSAINLLGSGNIRYQYKLEGYDREWQTATDITQVRYSLLPAGEYTFRLRASTDHTNWVNAGNRVILTVPPPVWQRWWFITMIVILLGAIIYQVIAKRDKKIKEQREEIETEQAINYFATSIQEHQTTDSILWDVARNCIGRLQFEDCVVYLLDPEGKVLVQKAAHGPKSPRQYEITHPLEIPLGKGIVGYVAETGKATIIRDTSLDPRYIVDDERRYSEIAVPIVSGKRVLGVIDCEHSKKGFFTQKHLSILTTIASLCANKITRAKAEEERQKAQAILMDTQHKMTEVEMQALRAQMNPHFIFNCLNSINRYIVKSDQVTASLYLTRFAKLIRLILDNSNARTVILTNELEALKLYIGMEALRFDKKFTYAVTVDKSLSTDNVEVPPLIIQPYVENAIWHGLLHRESDGRLDIAVNMVDENMLECIIEDNGVGRVKSQELKSKSATSKKSLGTKLTENRLSLLNKHAELNASVEIVDLYDENGMGAGTRVILRMPV